MRAGREYIPRGPEDEEKTLNELRAEQGGKKKKGKFKRAIALGSAMLVGGAMQEARADWRDKVYAGNEAARTVGGIIIENKRENTRRKEIEAQEKIEKERLEAEKKIQLEREKTMRQQEAMRTAREAGWKKVKTTTSENETVLENEEGQTPEERMELQRQLHKQEMEKQRRINSASEFIQRIKRLAAEKPDQEKQE